MGFPHIRMRRLRQNPIIRDMVQETRLSVSDFILPLFVCPGKKVRNQIKSMPGNFQLSIDELLKESDVISVHTPLTEETRHLFDGRALSLMKKTAYLINTARGPVVDENALVAALEKGVIAGAGLDVYENEPKLAPGLGKLENAVLAAHTGSATIEARTGMALLAAENLLAMLNGKAGPTCLNPEVYGK